ncbi:hypothetical protein ACLMJK_001463 [Lecanora helva]
MLISLLLTIPTTLLPLTSALPPLPLPLPTSNPLTTPSRSHCFLPSPQIHPIPSPTDCYDAIPLITHDQNPSTRLLWSHSAYWFYGACNITVQRREGELVRYDTFTLGDVTRVALRVVVECVVSGGWGAGGWGEVGRGVFEVVVRGTSDGGGGSDGYGGKGLVERRDSRISFGEGENDGTGSGTVSGVGNETALSSHNGKGNMSPAIFTNTTPTYLTPPDSVPKGCFPSGMTQIPQPDDCTSALAQITESATPLYPETWEKSFEWMSGSCTIWLFPRNRLSFSATDITPDTFSRREIAQQAKAVLQACMTEKQGYRGGRRFIGGKAAWLVSVEWIGNNEAQQGRMLMGWYRKGHGKIPSINQGR